MTDPTMTCTCCGLWVITRKSYRDIVNGVSYQLLVITNRGMRIAECRSVEEVNEVLTGYGVSLADFEMGATV